MHQRVVGALVTALDAQLSAEWEAVPDVEVVLQAGWPPTVRGPDVAITSADTTGRGEAVPRGAATELGRSGSLPIG